VLSDAASKQAILITQRCAEVFFSPFPALPSAVAPLIFRSSRVTPLTSATWPSRVHLQRIAQLSERATAARALRVSVEPGGCSGFQYKFTLESAGEHAEDDKIFMQNGAEVVVDECSLQLLRCTRVPSGS